MFGFHEDFQSLAWHHSLSAAVIYRLQMEAECRHTPTARQHVQLKTIMRLLFVENGNKTLLLDCSLSLHNLIIFIMKDQVYYWWLSWVHYTFSMIYYLLLNRQQIECKWTQRGEFRCRTCGAELDDLAPLRHGVLSVRLLGGGLDGHRVLCARTQEPMTSDRHREGNRLRHQLRRDVLKNKDAAGGFCLHHLLSHDCELDGDKQVELILQPPPLHHRRRHKPLDEPDGSHQQNVLSILSRSVTLLSFLKVPLSPGLQLTINLTWN